MVSSISIRLSAAVCAALALSACEEGMLAGQTTGAPAGAETAAAPTEFIERDAEAPEVFSADESALWDGRPSIGGIWVAHPDVTTPERVMIRNAGNGKEVVGALFRREREMPGPRIQVSSEAAEALGMLAGQPADLSVVALRRERIPVLPPEPDPVPAAEQGEIEATPLDPAATAAAAVAAVEATRPTTRPEPRPAIPAAEPAPAPAPAPEPEASAAPAPAAPAAPAAAALPPPAGSPEQPYVQIGIFSVEENARNAGESLRLAGVIPTIRESQSGDKSYWRVLVGPVTSVNERGAILAKVRELGYSDAYAVAN